MSVVSGITIIASCAEDCADEDDDVPILFERLNDWIEERFYCRPLKAAQESFNGTKRPQLFCAGAGMNAFPEDEFAAFAVSLPWEYPKNVVLVVQPEDGPTRVFRPT